MANFKPNHIPHNFQDITGQQFAEWLVIEKSNKKSKSGKLYWLCLNTKTNEEKLKIRDVLLAATRRIGKNDPVRFARSIAKEQGKTRYFNGTICPKGHVSERMTVNGRCVDCMKEHKLRPENVKKELKRLKKDRETNPEKYKIIWEKRRSNVKSKLDSSVRQRIKGHIKEKYKSKNFKKIMGYNFDDLKNHIERQFLKGMSWDNYGEWHIDHILPISYFNYNSYKDSDFKMCWALSNLRPLWAKDNYKKSSIRTHLI